MELRHLRSFLAVAEALSFTQASRRLHLSQPALTSQIKRLEEEIGAQLFVRNRRQVRLSEIGSIFVSEARETLDRAARAIERVQKASHGDHGRLRIGFVSSVALAMVPTIAVDFQRQFPLINLELSSLCTTIQLEALAAKTLDVGFVRLPAEQKGVVFVPIHKETFVIVLPKGHELADRRNLELAHLRAEKFVVYGGKRAPGLFDQLMALCAASDFTPYFVQEANDLYTTVGLVAAGRGVAILPSSIVIARVRGVVYKTLHRFSPRSVIALATCGENLDPHVQSFIDFAKSATSRSKRC